MRAFWNRSTLSCSEPMGLSGIQIKRSNSMCIKRAGVEGMCACALMHISMHVRTSRRPFILKVNSHSPGRQNLSTLEQLLIKWNFEFQDVFMRKVVQIFFSPFNKNRMPIVFFGNFLYILLLYRDQWQTIYYVKSGMICWL